MKQRLHPLEIGLMLLAAVVLTSGTIAVGTQTELADRVVRLHVLANSDSDEDQALKLIVRDAVLARTTDLLEGASDRGEALHRLEEALPELEETARAALIAQGYEGSVRVELGETAFPTKAYDGFALPAGEYLALRVLIGEAAGRNWWCVVFPPLCVTAAADVPAAALGAGLTEDQVALITEEDGYVLRFKTVELWGRLRQYWEGA